MNKVWLEREKEKHCWHVYFSFCKLTTQDSMCAVAKLHKAGGALGYFSSGYVPPGTPLIGTPFEKKFPVKLIPRSRNGPLFHTRARIRPKTDNPF